MLQKIDDFVWGIPLIVLILSIGVILTIRLKGVQIRKLPLAMKHMFSGGEDGEDGEVSGFGALCMALSATIGTGNIIGVATALVTGGPGALFWMWVAAFFGTATKYAECLLAIKYRVVAKDGHVVGGPFYYIEKGMGKSWKWLAKMFAVFGAGAGVLGIGTFTQVNGITSAVNSFFDPKNLHTVVLFGREYSWSVVIAGIIITIAAALVLIGGVKRISSVSQVIVPFMAMFYIVSAIIILVTHASEIPDALRAVIEGAFGLRAAAGGALGAMMIAIQKGVARGIFSNEAGLGSAPIAAATVKTDEPVEQGLVSMTGTVIDTLIICTMTGLSILVTDSWNVGLEGVDVTTRAFQMGLPFAPEFSSFLLMICLVFFAFTTIIGWNYYSERCIEYIVGDKPKVIMAFRWIYIFAVLIGPFMTVAEVWTMADIFNGLMAFPNLIALFALSGVVVSETNKYFQKNKDK
ncbi:MAG: alanine:cation symporter family protein [Agathobacter sp.]|nr:alanine:cation symporter family protein [Agathobacter sp.]